MNNGGEAADQMVREALQFSEVAIKLTALGFKNSLAIALAYAKENPKVRGKTSLDRLLREGKEMKIIPLQTKDLAQFKAYAKQYGVLFASIKDKGAQGEVLSARPSEHLFAGRLILFDSLSCQAVRILHAFVEPTLKGLRYDLPNSVLLNAELRLLKHFLFELNVRRPLHLEKIQAACELGSQEDCQQADRKHHAVMPFHRPPRALFHLLAPRVRHPRASCASRRPRVCLCGPRGLFFRCRPLLRLRSHLFFLHSYRCPFIILQTSPCPLPSASTSALPRFRQNAP